MFSQVRVLWTHLSGGELPWNLNWQPPIWSHLLRRRGTEGPWKLHESTPQNWRHSGDAYRGSGKSCEPPEMILNQHIMIAVQNVHMWQNNKKWLSSTGLVMQVSHVLLNCTHNCTWFWKGGQGAQTVLYKYMFYLKQWMCECGQTAGHVRGHKEHFESW